MIGEHLFERQRAIAHGRRIFHRIGRIDAVDLSSP
jgi:hypothetical protein